MSDRHESAESLQGGAIYPSLRGKSVFITGGGSGIGACLTEGFARQGAHAEVLSSGRMPRSSRTRASRIRRAG